MVTKKGTVFRVTGLPASRPDDELNTTLKIVINNYLSEEEQSKLRIDAAIVPSCYENGQKRAALMEFHGEVPTFLSELTANPLRDWQVEMSDTNISFDCHFFEFTQLYSSKRDAPIVAEYVAFL